MAPRPFKQRELTAYSYKHPRFPLRRTLTTVHKLTSRGNRPLQMDFEDQLHAFIYFATEMKNCIAQCDYFIGARTHSVIAGFSSLVPTGSIGYSVKAIGVNNDLLGTDGYVLPHDHLSIKGLIELFEKIQANRERIIDQLRLEVPRAGERAMQAEKHLLHVLG